jgi:hypothetical protein
MIKYIQTDDALSIVTKGKMISIPETDKNFKELKELCHNPLSDDSDIEFYFPSLEYQSDDLSITPTGSGSYEIFYQGKYYPIPYTLCQIFIEIVKYSKRWGTDFSMESIAMLLRNIFKSKVPVNCFFQILMINKFGFAYSNNGELIALKSFENEIIGKKIEFYRPLDLERKLYQATVISFNPADYEFYNDGYYVTKYTVLAHNMDHVSFNQFHSRYVSGFNCNLAHLIACLWPDYKHPSERAAGALDIQEEFNSIKKEFPYQKFFLPKYSKNIDADLMSAIEHEDLDLFITILCALVQYVKRSTTLEELILSKHEKNL